MADQGGPVRDIQGHVIGHIEDGVFLKRISFSKHILREPEPSIALDRWAWRTRIQPACHLIQVLDRESGDGFSIGIQEFATHAFELDRGYGRQLAVPLRLWQHQPAAQPRLL